MDMVARLRAALPDGWFPDVAPSLTAVLNGFAYGFARIYAILQFAHLQSRIATAVGPWLDGIAADFFGASVSRQVGQSDETLRTVITAQILTPFPTRAGLAEVLTNLTGHEPVIFEPANPTYTGGWDVACGWDTAGAWGSTSLPFQFFVDAYRPNATSGISGGGWDIAMAWDSGGGQWVNADGDGVTDAQIQSAVARAIPAGSTAWLRINA